MKNSLKTDPCDEHNIFRASVEQNRAQYLYLRRTHIKVNKKVIINKKHKKVICFGDFLFLKNVLYKDYFSY